MASISKICTKCLVLKNGQIDFHGDTSTAIERYLSAAIQSNKKIIDLALSKQNEIELQNITINKNPLIEQVIHGNERNIRIDLSVITQKELSLSVEAYLLDCCRNTLSFNKIVINQCNNY